VNGIIQNYTEKNKQAGGTDTSSMISQSSSSTSSNSQQDQSTNNLFNTRLDQQGQGYSSGSSSSYGMGNTNTNNDISTIVQRIPKSGSVSPAVQWEESTNSLVVTAPKELMRKIREVISRLDIRRPQVLIEAVIAEVSERRQKELGIQWNPSGNVSFQTKFLPVLPLSFIGDNGKLATTAGGLNTVGQGISLTFNGNQIRFLLAALETDTDSNVLATPNLVTLDNEPAQIKVGEKISFSTSQITNSPTGGNPQSFFEREDVGLVLTINPQIAPIGAIKLLIQKYLSAVFPGTS
jgi:general secretion pathway protein D